MPMNSEYSFGKYDDDNSNLIILKLFEGCFGMDPFDR